MLTGSGAPIRSLCASEVDRICRIADVAVLHSYAPPCIQGRHGAAAAQRSHSYCGCSSRRRWSEFLALLGSDPKAEKVIFCHGSTRSRDCDAPTEVSNMVDICRVWSLRLWVIRFGHVMLRALSRR